MSIASQISRLQTAKADIKNKVNSYLPSTINNELIDVYDDKIALVIDKFRNNCPTSTKTDGILTNALDVPVKNYKIYGNSTQGSNPSPSNPQEITSVGDLVTSGEHQGKYKIDVKVEGKNMCNSVENNSLHYGTYTGYTILNNAVYLNGSALMGFKIKVNPSTTYSMSIYKNDNSNVMLRLREYSEEPSDWTSNIIVQSYNQGILSGLSTATVTTSATTKWVIMAIYGTGSTATLSDFQFNAGSTASSYEPFHTPVTVPIYLDRPLYKAGDVADYVEFATGKRHNLVGRVVLNGTETWYLDTTKTITQVFRGTNFVFKLGTWILCNYFKQNVSGDSEKIVYDFSTKELYLAINKSTASTANDFKQWLSTHNTEVIYELATPTEENITLPQLPLFDGTNIITYGTEVQPSSQEIVYITKGGNQ